MAVLGNRFLGNRSAAVTPVTVGGKVFTFFVLIVGLRASQFQRGCLLLHCRKRVRGSRSVFYGRAHLGCSVGLVDLTYLNIVIQWQWQNPILVS